ncbi:hypothetical protein GX51_04421 [Blastomyces parvus]|uniref:Uncharacterized protein n=1 Tax=Blastomyces parvus TaxID=2060905 RepID=A0A2B7X1P1_9EURO|nr:hypothetical protein GX51_04421 [Blastomyces parvus]
MDSTALRRTSETELSDWKQVLDAQRCVFQAFEHRRQADAEALVRLLALTKPRFARNGWLISHMQQRQKGSRR